MKSILLLYEADGLYHKQLEEHLKVPLSLSMTEIKVSNSLNSNKVRAKVIGKDTNVLTIGTLTDMARISEALSLVANPFTVHDSLNLVQIDDLIGYKSTENVVEDVVTMVSTSEVSTEESDSKTTLATMPSDNVSSGVSAISDYDIEMDTDLDITSKNTELEAKYKGLMGILQSELDIAKVKVLELETQLETLNSIDTSVLEESLKVAKVECSLAQERYTTLKIEYDDLSNMHNTILCELDTAKTRLKELETRLEVLVLNTENLGEQADELDTTKVDLESTNLELQEQISVLESRNIVLQSRLDAYTVDESSLSSIELFEYRYKEELEGYYSALMQEYNSKLTLIMTLQEQTIEAKVFVDSQIDNLQSTIAERDRFISQLQEDIETKTNSIEALNVQLDLAVTDSELLKLNISQSNKTISELTVEKDSYLLKKETLQTDVNALKSQLDELLSENNNLTAVSNDKSHSLAELQVANRNLSKEISQLRLTNANNNTSGVSSAIQMLSKLDFNSKLIKLGSLDKIYTNIHIFGSLSTETDMSKIIRNLIINYTESRFLFIDLDYIPNLDYVFGYNGVKTNATSVAAWLAGTANLSDCIVEVGNHCYLHGSYVGLNEAALLNVDWGVKLNELNNSGMIPIIMWGTTGSAIKDNLLSTWVGRLHIHLCAAGSDLSMRSAYMQLHRFNFSEDIKFIATDVITTVTNKILGLIEDKHKGYKQILSYGGTEIVTL